MSDGAARVSISTQMSKLWINEAHAYAPISIRIITWICSVTEPRSVFQLIVQHTFTVLIHSHDSHGETAIFFFLSKNLLKPTQHQTEDRRSERPPGEHGGTFSSRREISLRSCERPKKNTANREWVWTYIAQTATSGRVFMLTFCIFHTCAQ